MQTGATARDAGRLWDGGTPQLALDGFAGPLEQLLELARARQVDLARLALPDLVDQLAAALTQAGRTTPLGEQGGWVVMAAWLLLWRSQLLLPADTLVQAAADDRAGQLRRRLLALDKMQAGAAWLDRRPQLGRDVFCRGQPELVDAGTEQPCIDVIEFLWASLALFDDDLPKADTAVAYMPPRLNLHSVAEARTRILSLLQDTPDGRLLGQLLPDFPGQDAPTPTRSRARSRWTSTFVAGLELARQGAVLLDQQDAFTPINFRLTDATSPRSSAS